MSLEVSIEKLTEALNRVADLLSATGATTNVHNTGSSGGKETPPATGTDDKPGPATADQKKRAKELGLKGYTKLDSAALEEMILAKLAEQQEQEEEEEDDKDPLADMLGGDEDEQDDTKYTLDDVKAAMSALVTGQEGKEAQVKAQKQCQVILKAHGCPNSKLSELKEAKFAAVMKAVKDWEGKL